MIIRLLARLFRWGEKPNYEPYATGVLQELVDATPMQQIFEPPYLYSRVHFANDRSAEITDIAIDFSREVEKILKRVTGGAVESVVRHDDINYYVEFKAYVPPDMAMNAFKDKLRQAIQERHIPAQLRQR